jgi:hypothetical protein
VKKFLLGLMALASISSFASSVHVGCVTNELTTTGDYIYFSAVVFNDYELQNVVFKTNAYTSEAVTLQESLGSRDLTVGAWTIFEAYRDSSYAIAPYLPAYLDTYQNNESLPGSISVNDFENGVYGENYEMECKTTKR